MSGEVVLAVHKLVARRAGRVVVRNVDFAVSQGERVYIWGENGSGKTTLLEALLGLIHSEASRRSWAATVKTPVADAAFLKGTVTYVRQKENVFPSLTLRQNLILSAPRHPIEKARVREKVDWLISELPELASAIDRYPHQVSAGQRQLTAAARAFTTTPLLLVLDEATAGMSSRLASWFHSTVAAQLSPETAVLVTDQHKELASAWATRTFETLTRREDT